VAALVNLAASLRDSKRANEQARALGLAERLVELGGVDYDSLEFARVIKFELQAVTSAYTWPEDIESLLEQGLEYTRDVLKRF
jgi:hypothetical protein